ncbi:MAG: tail fiber domain-containing protein [Saprospiraceae bacterium]|nr:tail fiber domain-containing protein [Saprospiraceae bacterium]
MQIISFSQVSKSLIYLLAFTQLCSEMRSQSLEVEGSLTATSNIKTLGNLIIENNSPHLYFMDKVTGDLPIRIWSGSSSYFDVVETDLFFRFAPSGGAFHYNLSIKKEGEVGVGTRYPETALHVVGGSDASLSNPGYLMLGYGFSSNIIIDNNEIMARNNGQTSPLYLNHDGGAIYARGIRNIGDHKNMQFNSSTGEIGWDNSSRRYKMNIETLHDDWSKIFDTRPVKYCRPNSSNRWEYGYIAEEMDSIGLTNLVGYDAEGIPDDVKYDRMVLYLTELVKIQNKKSAEQQDQIDRLEAKLDQLMHVHEKQNTPN